jgi:hypothetical protein
MAVDFLPAHVYLTRRSPAFFWVVVNELKYIVYDNMKKKDEYLNKYGTNSHIKAFSKTTFSHTHYVNKKNIFTDSESCC